MDELQEVLERGKWPIRPIWVTPALQGDTAYGETCLESPWKCLEIQEEIPPKFRYQ